MKSFPRAILLALVLSSPALADTVRGAVSLVEQAGATEEVKVAEVRTATGETYRIVDPETVDLLGWLRGEQVVLEGRGAPDAFTVSRLVEPEFVPQMTGVLSATRPGLSGRRQIQVADGSQVEFSGPNFPTLYTLSRDLQRRAITFSAFKLRDARGALRKLVIMEVEARTLERVVLTDSVGLTLFKLVLTPLLLVDPPEVHGDVPAGQTVWIQRRSLLGGSLEVRNRDHAAGFVTWSALQIGQVVDDAEQAAEAEAQRGAVDSVEALQR